MPGAAAGQVELFGGVPVVAADGDEAVAGQVEAGEAVGAVVAVGVLGVVGAGVGFFTAVFVIGVALAEAEHGAVGQGTVGDGFADFALHVVVAVDGGGGAVIVAGEPSQVVVGEGDAFAEDGGRRVGIVVDALQLVVVVVDVGAHLPFGVGFFAEVVVVVVFELGGLSQGPDFSGHAVGAVVLVGAYGIAVFVGDAEQVVAVVVVVLDGAQVRFGNFDEAVEFVVVVLGDFVFFVGALFKVTGAVIDTGADVLGVDVQGLGDAVLAAPFYA